VCEEEIAALFVRYAQGLSGGNENVLLWAAECTDTLLMVVTVERENLTAFGTTNTLTSFDARGRQQYLPSSNSIHDFVPRVLMALVDTGLIMEDATLPGDCGLLRLHLRSLENTRNGANVEDSGYLEQLPDFEMITCRDDAMLRIS
jgi:hypothetical protein